MSKRCGKILLGGYHCMLPGRHSGDCNMRIQPDERTFTQSELDRAVELAVAKAVQAESEWWNGAIGGFPDDLTYRLRMVKNRAAVERLSNPKPELEKGDLKMLDPLDCQHKFQDGKCIYCGTER